MPGATEAYRFLLHQAHAGYTVCIYFSLVAIPPRMCLSCLLTSRTFLASMARAGLILDNLEVTSLCTVDLLTPNLSAA